MVNIVFRIGAPLVTSQPHAVLDGAMYRKHLNLVVSGYHRHFTTPPPSPSTTFIMPFHIQGPRIIHTHKRRTIIPGFLYVTFFGLRPRFSMQLGRHVHIN
ncbi:hypothetical protein P691DRAFT_727273 [Macrolepiota fuliginosa MF-IS2]|uniref:Uncharacterized protein n=1 Tax=Macrolepiota fuliginosa MF-IS2 TaxID=1400762 RepID=A0A9P5XGA6_9AGAR|nr:hypothetical protein P691DRAFT_727273 [Macrolepiota fuliginosa MF-IS2]